MALTKCAHGHIYDTDLYGSCPYCNSNQPVIDFQNGGMAGTWGNPAMGGTPVGASGHTQPPPGYAAPGPSNPGRTQPPPGYMPAPERVSDAGKTRPPAGYVPPIPQSRKISEDDQVTRAQMVTGTGRELVVGWLVCIQGTEKGKDYHVLGKVNTLGRDSSNDISIKDPKISRERHVCLGYDPRGNTFHLIPEKNTNNIYLNGTAIYSVMPLHAYDTIEMGDTTLVFVPLCSDRFTWEQGASHP